MAEIFAWGAQRKGKQQKRRASQLLAESAVPKSEQINPFVSWLLEMFVLKQLSAVQVQTGAKAAVDGGLLHAEVIKMASIGSHGRYPNHCNEDLCKRFDLKNPSLPPIDVVEVPVLDKNKEVVWKPMSSVFLIEFLLTGLVGTQKGLLRSVVLQRR